MKFYRGEVLSSHPKFPKGSAAEAGSSAMPVEITAPDIVYTKEDDKAIDQYNREIGEPALLFSIFLSIRAGLNSTISSAKGIWHSVCWLMFQYLLFARHSLAVWYLCHEVPRPGWSS